eukprot:CAMPEP_0171938964 /NCGR_PEP_ID=MMETSP0993-20121228/35912_1 /TAXON_ID=483369 /ORGANISM="non described non described, Strain CCMP2098" /LENGTH=179 /DNA_ID=CAMNT_0012580683 /DNA_START=209 /DNA_END=744 /DNA_ORIENTATION=+
MSQCTPLAPISNSVDELSQVTAIPDTADGALGCFSTVAATTQEEEDEGGRVETAHKAIRTLEAYAQLCPSAGFMIWLESGVPLPSAAPAVEFLSPCRASFVTTTATRHSCAKRCKLAARWPIKACPTNDRPSPPNTGAISAVTESTMTSDGASRSTPVSTFSSRFLFPPTPPAQLRLSR